MSDCVLLNNLLLNAVLSNKNAFIHISLSTLS